MKRWKWVRDLFIYLLEALDITPGELGWTPKPEELHVDIDIDESFQHNGKTIRLVIVARAIGQFGIDASGHVRALPNPMKVQVIRKRLDVTG